MSKPTPPRPPLRSPAGGVIPAQQPSSPELQAPGGHQATVEARYSGGGDNRNLWIGGALALLVLVALGLVLLPGGERTTDEAEPTPVPAAQEEAPKPGVTRAQAQTALQVALQRQAELEVLRAPDWAGEDWADLLTAMNIADEAFQRGRFGVAQQAWNKAEQDFVALRESRASRANGYLGAGQAALDADDSTTAVTSFEAALAADPDSVVGREGLERARKRPEMLAALAEGDAAEDDGDLEAAAAAFQRAIGIDAADPRPRAALERVAGPLAEARFQSAMSRALNSMQAGRFADTRAAINEAAKVRPDDPALRDLRQRLLAAQRAAGLRDLRRRAGQAVAAEDWSTAVEHYQAALKIDANVGFARDGLDKARERQQLHGQLDHYLARPDRLYGAEPLRNAKQLLASAGNGAEPGLNARIDKLRAAVEIADTPIGVSLRSDGHTAVSIYHVGRLGTFTRLGLELRPGDYTAVGSRDGYRDVRRVFQVRPGVPVPPINVRCTEAL